jgi:hypothetical protein
MVLNYVRVTIINKMKEETKVFKNSVIKVSVDTKKWLKKAGVRAVKTMAQTFVATVGTATVMGAVDWKMVLSASVLAGILSIATSVAGIPEVEAEE